MKDYYEIKIGQSIKQKSIKLLLICLLFIILMFILGYFSLNIYITLLSPFIVMFSGLNGHENQITFDNFSDNIKISILLIALIVLILIFIIFILYLFFKKKKETIEINDKCLKKCIKCNEIYDINEEKCPHCDFNSNIEIKCDYCQAYNNINSVQCIKCGKKISLEELLYKLNRDYTFTIAKSIILVIFTFLLLNTVLAFLLSLFICISIYNKIKEYNFVINIINTKIQQ